MKYGTKLYIAFVSITAVSVLLALAIVYFETRRQFLNELRSKIKSIAATTAVLIDGNQLLSILTRQDEYSPVYIKLRNVLRRARTANRRDDVYVKYMFIMRPSKTHPDSLETVVDASIRPESVSHVGQINDQPVLQSVLQHLHEEYSPEKFLKDQFGSWLTGFAPIYDTHGQYVGTLVVDIYATDVNLQLNQLIWFGLTALLASLILALTVAYFMSKTATCSLHKIYLAVEKIGKGDLEQKIELNTSDEFADLSERINQMTRGLKERDRMKMNFSRYVSQHVLEKIMHSDTPTKLEGERKKITVLFSDIRQFTYLAEKLPPEQIVALLNEFFEEMIDVVFKNNGTLDKFTGDGVMVEFGSPLEDPLQEKNAVMAALEMQDRLKVLCDRWEAEGKSRIEMGIGIHTGIAVVGNIGSTKRMEYTAIGDTVNVASRLEQETKKSQKPVLISEATFPALGDDFKSEKLGAITLPGRVGEITIYSIEHREKR